MPRKSLFWKVLNKHERSFIVRFETSPPDGQYDPYLPDDVRFCGMCGEPIGSFSCGCDEYYQKLINKAKRIMKKIKQRE